MKLRVLCLHGKEQTAEIFRTRLGRLPHWSKSIADFVYIDAPHALPAREGNDIPGRSWFNRRACGAHEQASLDEALQLIDNTWASRGPFHGILGFSQGGTVAMIIASLVSNDRYSSLKFVISFGAPNLSSWTLPINPEIVSMHFAGSTDAVVSVANSKALSDRFDSAQFIEHEQGHCVPMKKPLMDLVVSFMSARLSEVISPPRPPPSSLTLSPNKASSIGGSKSKIESSSFGAVTEPNETPTAAPAPALIPTCSSDDLAEQQQMELEVLQSIYGDELEIIRAAPQSAGMPTCCISILLSSPTQPDPLNNSKDWLSAKQLRLQLSMTENYPGGSLLGVQVVTGNLSLQQFNLAMRRSLNAAVTAVANDGGDVYACVEAAKDWISSGSWQDCGRVPESIPSAKASDSATGNAPRAGVKGAVLKPVLTLEESCLHLSVFAEESEEQADWMVAQATREAAVVAAALRYQSDSSIKLDDIIDLIDVTGLQDEADVNHFTSAGGLWNYTIGLVGKPSAGKSSFYNAATCAAFSRDGRRMAAVAAHPFTTIEPNIGPGFFPGPADNNSELPRGTLYGRDAQGRRLLPVIIKDVAGLVPGAYKGRGKGNKFLADLCDADVLVHVVDSTGKSDKDGNKVVMDASEERVAAPATDSDTKGSSPSEDSVWVREELHRWIHGNVKVKWASVFRKAKDKYVDRVMALFSGYQGPRAYTLQAMRRAKIKLTAPDAMNALDLHRLVAHFLAIRFPTVLALNKVDDFDDVEEGRRTVAKCQEEAVMRGEVAVAVCAKAENWFQLKQACQGESSATVPSMQMKPIQGAGEETLETVGDASESGASSSGALSRLSLPPVGSLLWLENERILTRARDLWGGSGVMDALAAAVSLKPPVYCYPVSDLETEAPMAWSSVAGKDPCDAGLSGESIPRLIDCILLKQGSTVGDVFESLKKGALAHAIVQGDFVRAEGRALDCGSRKRQLGRDDAITGDCAVLRVQTNRKSVWQQAYLNATQSTA